MLGAIGCGAGVEVEGTGSAGRGEVAFVTSGFGRDGSGLDSFDSSAGGGCAGTRNFSFAGSSCPVKGKENPSVIISNSFF